MSKDTYVPNFKKHYFDVVLGALQKKFDYKNKMQLPTIEKVVVNMGVGEAVKDKKHLQNAVKELELITGQKCVTTVAKKSIATFKLRDGMAIGCKVTLRKDRMWEFLDRLINIALPRVRDFRGVSDKSFDSQANYALGIKEQIVFPEINYDDVDRTRGMDIVICTSTTNKKEAKELLSLFKMPFKAKGA